MADAPTTTSSSAENPTVASSGGTTSEVVATSPATVAPTLLEQFDAQNVPPVEPAAPKAETPAEPAPDAAPKPADPAAEKKPDQAEVKPPEAEAPKEAAPAEPAQLEPIDYFATLKVPETLVIDDANKSDLTAALDTFRADPILGAQELIDLHTRSLQQLQERVVADQYRIWNETRTNWQNEVMADPEIGGAGHQTAMAAVARVRDMLVPSQDRSSFSQFLSVTGAGDHPAFLRMLHQAARFLDEPGLPTTDVKPPPDLGRSPGPRRAVLYDNPRSNTNR